MSSNPSPGSTPGDDTRTTPTPQPQSVPMNPHDRSASATSVDTITTTAPPSQPRLPQPSTATPSQLPPSPAPRSAASPVRSLQSIGRGRAPSQATATTNRDSSAYGSFGHTLDASAFSAGTNAPLSPSIAGPGSVRRSSHAYQASGQSQATSNPDNQRRVTTNPPGPARRGSKAALAAPKDGGRPKLGRSLSTSRTKAGKGKARGNDSDSDGGVSSTQSQGGRGLPRESALTDADDSDEELDTSLAFGRALDRAKALDQDEDDEVRRIDRGEELIRKRNRERKREKKEAERRERKRREEEARRERQVQRERQRDYGSLSSSVGGPPTQTQNQTPNQATDEDAGRRSISASGAARDGFAPGLGDDGRAPPLSPILIPSPGPGQTQYARDQFSQSQPRAVSYASSVMSSRGGQTPTGLAPGGGDWEETEVQEGEEPERRITEEEQEELAREEAEEEAAREDEQEMEEEEEEDDEDVEDDDVEYTLKDRQDAINAEHPFGLPIWKPALYKKSRSVTRNAETALHLQPSLAAERHLLPGNILWTILFGWWLAFICALASAFLMIVPWGGAKYSRVIWELAGYIFWPFGRYVARIQDDADEDQDEEGDARDEDEEEEYDPDNENYDVEDAGKTWGRNSSGTRTFKKSSNGSGTVRPGVDLPYDQNEEFAMPDPTQQYGSYQDSELPDAPLSHGASTPTQAQSRRGDGQLNGGRDTIRARQYGAATSNGKTQASGSRDPSDERSPLLKRSKSAGSATRFHDDDDDDDANDGSNQTKRRFRVRALGRLMYWTVFYLLVAPILGFVCLICWGGVFTIPMAKLLWVLIRHLADEPLALYFRSPRISPNGDVDVLKAGQQAPPQSKRTVAAMKAAGRIVGSEQKILLCTYRAVGLQYYKYTIDGVNIMFINLLPLVFFVIIDFFFLEPFVEHHHVGGFFGFIASQATIFTLALLSVIPLSYFIGTAVASISAQSSIGMGAVINATFGSIIEILLYAIALTQRKGKLVEGSIIGSLLAGVLLMPGMSMIGGATRRKEQKFNARSAGVTSTMLIMAIIGTLTPTLFYEIYGTFQLTCNDCPPNGDTWQCKHCYYEHVDPTDDPFYNRSVKYLAYYCAVILVLSYLVGLWFSLRTHASQIWQNAAPPPVELPVVGPVGPLDLSRQSVYKRLPAQFANILPGHRGSHSGQPRPMSTATNTPFPTNASPEFSRSQLAQPVDPLLLPPNLTEEDLQRVVAAVNTANALGDRSSGHLQPAPLRASIAVPGQERPRTLHRQASRMSQIAHAREPSKEVAHDDGGGGHGGHDAPNWSRFKSASVLMGCTVLYAIIAEVLVDEIDVVLQGSGIPEKFLGVTLFALVPNTTEFMNAILFARNGNIALSMEIGSAYALQVCLLQIPAMIAFSAFYSIGRDDIKNAVFTLIFPRWDVIATIFSVFLLTYTYIEARSNYFRGTLLCFSYLVLLGGFYWAPNGSDDSDNPMMASVMASDVGHSARLQAFLYSLFSH